MRVRHEQSLEPGEMHLAAPSDELRGDWQDLEGHLRRIRCRTLFCWGMADGFLTPDYPLMLANMVPHGQLYVMDGTSHHLQEERPWDYFTIVAGFLAQSEPPAAVRAPRRRRRPSPPSALRSCAAPSWSAVLTATTGTWVGSPESPWSDGPQAPP